MLKRKKTANINQINKIKKKVRLAHFMRNEYPIANASDLE